MSDVSEGEGYLSAVSAQLALALQQAEDYRQRYEQTQQEYEDFKVKVREVAIRYAERYEWCEVVSTALVEMGLGPLEQEYTVIVTVTGEIERTVEAGSEEEAVRKATEEVDLSIGSFWTLHDEEFRVTDIETRVP